MAGRLVLNVSAKLNSMANPAIAPSIIPALAGTIGKKAGTEAPFSIKIVPSNLIKAFEPLQNPTPRPKFMQLQSVAL